jgi:beta-1,4-N-acetylglucosaminyltransferase
MDSRNISSAHEKRCFVTIGATAAFSSLIRAVLEPAFVKALQKEGYTSLRIQYGDQDGESLFQDRLKELKDVLGLDGLTVSGFGFKTTGLRDEMAAVKGDSQENEGMVVSHAG